VYIIQLCIIISIIGHIQTQPISSASGQQSFLRWQEALHEQRSLVALLAPKMTSHNPVPVTSLQHEVKPISRQVLGSVHVIILLLL
jgi:hypothetical protein